MTVPVPLLGRMAPISLERMNATARLLHRVDRKYFVPRPVLERVLAERADQLRVLEIDGRRSFRYRTVYFDTPDFLFFRAHRQGRRQRYKVRTREYCDTGGAFLEVKSKGYRGMTVKERQEHDPAALRRLDPVPGRFAQERTGVPSADLVPVAETIYHRTTLTGPELRITLDSELECVEGDGFFAGPDDVLVETKSPGRGSAVDGELLRAGVRPHRVSKYCVAVSLLHPWLSHNPWTPTLRRYFGQER